MGYGFVIDYTERFRRVLDGLAILQLSSGDEIELPVPAEHEIISKLSLSAQRFDARGTNNQAMEFAITARHDAG